LTEPAVDALRHVDVVTGRAAGSVKTFFGFDGDGLGGTDRFAEFACDAAFFTRGVAAQRVFAPESGGDGAFFEGVVDGVSIAAGREEGASVQGGGN